MAAKDVTFQLLDLGLDSSNRDSSSKAVNGSMVEEPAPLRILEASRLQLQIFESEGGADRRPRRWDPQARAANTFLSHSIEYLADSREFSSGRLSGREVFDPDGEAILILMQAKRDLHLSLPYIERRKKSVIWKGFERRKERQN